MSVNLKSAAVILLSIFCMNNSGAAANEPLEGTAWLTSLQEAEAALKRGAWAEALAKVDQAEANWPKVWGCGLASAGSAYQRDLLRAAALEGIGRTSEAAEIYWSTMNAGSTHEADLRLVELYWAAAQLEPLRQILDEMDLRHRYYLRRFDPTSQDQHPRASSMRKALAMRQAASTGQWSQLIKVLREGRLKPTGYSPREWFPSWEPIYAASLLATQPAETVPRILEDLDGLEGEVVEPPNWHDLALGMAGTGPALAKLRARATKLPQQEVPSLYFWVHLAGAAFVSIVAQSGRSGEELLRQLAIERETPASIRRALRAWEQGELKTDLPRIAFPPLPKEIKLPLTPEAALAKSRELRPIPRGAR